MAHRVLLIIGGGIAAFKSDMGHIELSRSADLIVVAPATANLMSRAAHGVADDLATTTLLATDTRVLYAGHAT